MATFQPSQFSGGPYGASAGSRDEFDKIVAQSKDVTKQYTEEEKDEAKKKLLQSGGGLAVLAGLLLLGPFVVTPWIVKQFQPEWSYGKRVATGFVVSFGVGAVTGIVRAASGGEKK